MSKKKMLISATIVIAVIPSITLFLLFNNNKDNSSERLLTIKTSETLNSPISIVMKEYETESILFSSENIKNSKQNINIKKDYGEFSLALIINNQEQEILGYGNPSEQIFPIELSFSVNKNNIIVNSKVTAFFDQVEKKLTFPFEN